MEHTFDLNSLMDNPELFENFNGHYKIDLSAVLDNSVLFENFDEYLPILIRSIIDDTCYISNLRKKGLDKKYAEKLLRQDILTPIRV